jgi:exosortase/archaeosortase family protein
VLTDTVRGPTGAARFVLRGVAGSLAFFGLLRLNWTEAQVVLPFTRMQAGFAAGLFGAPASPVEATLACSGADALALCLGAVLAYPVTWRARLAGAAGGIALIVALNTARIGSLGRAAASPSWFNALHLYVWPAVLTLAIAGYVFWWMRVADRRLPPDESGTSRAVATGPPSPFASARQAPVSAVATEHHAPRPSRRFIVLTIGFVLLFSAASPLYLESSSVLALADFVAHAAAAILGVVGVNAHAAANVLSTPRGAFLVTQECIATPLIPVSLAAVCAYATTWRRVILGVLATLPLFIALGIARLLVVALPDAASPLFVVHAFYQLLLGALIVYLAAMWRHRGRRVFGHALAGIVVAVLFMGLLGPLYTRAVTYPAETPLADPQGAIALLPAFQVGLYLALWVAAFIAVGWTRFLAGLALLGLTQTAGLLMLQILATHSGLTAHVRDVRGWAIAGPVLIFVAVVNLARAPR